VARSAAEDASEVLPPPPRLSASESEGETDVSESGVAGPSPDHRRQEERKIDGVRKGKTQGQEGRWGGVIEGRWAGVIDYKWHWCQR
jgi:hypothetical protein